jgi:hypothetical protein
VLAAAAHDLGVFSAQGLDHAAELDGYSWAARRWLRGWVGLMRRFGVGRAAEDRAYWTHPLMREVVPPSAMDHFAGLWDEAEGILEVVESLPTTVSHHDAQWSNLFGADHDGSSRRTVAIDWSFLGLAPVGQDLGHHVACNLYNQAIDAHQADRHDQASTSAYLSGLREAGWHGDVRDVMLARSAAAALQIGTFLVADLIDLCDGPGGETGPGEPAWPDMLAERHGVDVSEVMARWGRSLTYLLDLGQEARELAGRRH